MPSAQPEMVGREPAQWKRHLSEDTREEPRGAKTSTYRMRSRRRERLENLPLGNFRQHSTRIENGSNSSERHLTRLVNARNVPPSFVTKWCGIRKVNINRRTYAETFVCAHFSTKDSQIGTVTSSRPLLVGRVNPIFQIGIVPR